jgi:ATP phosphoribosyltransferase regulatory subunit
MYLYHNIENDLVIDVKRFYHRKQIIQKMKQRFSTFGYQEMSTSTFEPYDLYVHMNGTVNKQEMMKTIDNNGEVLVLRPDITIPLTQQIASHNKKLEEDLRYFYILDVFRQAKDAVGNREQTQAGVEYFGNPTPAADAEIIALAIQMLEDIKLDNVKIELGHAGFFGQIIQEMNLKKQDLQELKHFIQAKNVPEIEQLLKRLAIHPDMKVIVTSLPFLYGAPEQVITKAKDLPLTPKMIETLDNITEIYAYVQAYGVHEHIVIDLSLINHMDYYSDLIFQGFIKHIGKPILMGGRYNTLANQFGAEIPAIGFASDVDLLTEFSLKDAAPTMPKIDLHCLYEQKNSHNVVKLANRLREHELQVVTYPKGTEKARIPETTYSLERTEKGYSLTDEMGTYPFTSEDEVVDFLKKGKN